ncbi:ribonuclease HII [Maribrevibacterium harenarium]|uniref:Ribonuclease HII n=1 Tax=Maribrevibacterium harenarium TaxID=2589817 RepID=A0A501WTT7_9GAMM|nr:ribonuclease HII [Maribrevibacterium harenarium]TPE52818.1 ribonuclease HII [Maribrevibacterium harenarium]
MSKTPGLAPFISEKYVGVLLAGVDEAGRGPLAGDVVAAAVILNPDKPIVGLNDSKKLTEKKREALYEEIIEKALAYSIARADVGEIDRLNILHASMLAMTRAINTLSPSCEHALIDGNRLPKNIACSAEAVVKGDARHPAIAAASILAKVTRDREITALDREYPQYGFAKHKGYPTAMHLQAIEEHGVCPLHRRSFGPVRKILEGS